MFGPSSRIFFFKSRKNKKINFAVGFCLQKEVKHHCLLDKVVWTKLQNILFLIWNSSTKERNSKLWKNFWKIHLKYRMIKEILISLSHFNEKNQTLMFGPISKIFCFISRRNKNFLTSLSDIVINKEAKDKMLNKVLEHSI